MSDRVSIRLEFIVEKASNAPTSEDQLDKGDYDDDDHRCADGVQLSNHPCCLSPSSAEIHTEGAGDTPEHPERHGTADVTNLSALTA